MAASTLGCFPGVMGCLGPRPLRRQTGETGTTQVSFGATPTSLVRAGPPGACSRPGGYKSLENHMGLGVPPSPSPLSCSET